MTFWDSLSVANDALNGFIKGGLPSMTEKRHKEFVRQWNKMKDRASSLCQQIEKEADTNIEPVEVVLPWNTDSFQEAWQK